MVEVSHLQKHEPPEIDVSNPWADDQLERKAVASELTTIIASIRQQFVISLHSPFGTGKTFFLTRWRQQLINDGYHVMYFNAWKTDFSHDPLAAFITSLKRQIDGISDASQRKTVKDRFDDLVRVSGALAPQLPSLIAKAALRKTIGGETASDLINLYRDITTAMGSLAKERLDAQEAAESSVEQFKHLLADIVEGITKNQNDESKKKLLIFVDELDRCRPTYAVEVLEAIKHLFSVRGLVFILAVDDVQLKSSVASVYGGQLDADGYMRRFIDWRINLPKPSNLEYAKFLCSRFSVSDSGHLNKGFDFYNGEKSLIQGFSIFSDMFGLTLRQQEQIFIDINLFLRSLGDGQSPLAFPLGSLAVLRLAKRKLYDGCCTKAFPPSKIIEEIETRKHLVANESKIKRWPLVISNIHSWFLTEDDVQQLKADTNSLNTELNNIAIQGDAINHEKRDELEKQIKHNNNMIECFNSENRFFHNNRVSLAREIYDRLEMIERFTR